MISRIVDEDSGNIVNGTLVNVTSQGTEETGINGSPKLLVIFLISPEYLVIFAYSILFWQLVSLYIDGHASFFKSFILGKGKYFISMIGLGLLGLQILMLILYLYSQIKATAFTIQLVIINFAAPFIAFILMFHFAQKISGSPLRAAVYSQKLKVLQVAVLVWSTTRIIRAIGGIFEGGLFTGMILGL